LPDTHDLGPVYSQYARVPKDAPVFQLGETREIEGEFRVGEAVVIRLPLAREPAWFGLRLSWLSIQVKLPLGKKMERSRHGIVLGRWMFPVDDEWEALYRAVHLGHEMDGTDERNFEDPTSESIHESVRVIAERRVADDEHAGADG
jgi:hypothetical protein